MVNFLKTILAVIIGFFISICLILLAFIGMGSAFSPKKESTKENSILSLDFKKPVYEYSQPIYIKNFNYEITEENTLTAILRAIKYAKTDKHIKGIILGSTEGITGKTHLADIRKAVADFKTTGKFVYAFGESISQYDYFLHSVADSLFLGTLGSVDIQGLSAEVLYYKDLQEKTGIHMEIFRHGKYKSAVEPFLENTMSEANREQISAYLHSLWQSYADEVVQSRGFSLSDLNQIADSLWGRTPELALKHHLVDKIAFHDEFENSLCKVTKSEKIEDLHLIPIEEYAQNVSLETLKEAPKKAKKDKIAIIFCDGEIIEGKSQREKIGNETIIESLRDAREDKNIKAIILRINSPGGSGLASELIHREIALTQKVKPVYTSMGNWAASGGYYIACNSNRIFADKETLTGSIGVFGLIPNAKELADKIGIHSQQVETHPHALTYSLLEKTPEKTREVITEGIERFYKKFVQRVADGRKITWEKVDSLAQGRVWTGADALKHGLIDQIGSLNDVIDYVVKEKNLSSGNYSLIAYPIIEVDFSEFFKKQFQASTRAELRSLLREEIGEDTYDQLQRINYSTRYPHSFLQARVPYEIKVK